MEIAILSVRRRFAAIKRIKALDSAHAVVSSYLNELSEGRNDTNLLLDIK